MLCRCSGRHQPSYTRGHSQARTAQLESPGFGSRRSMIRHLETEQHHLHVVNKREQCHLVTEHHLATEQHS